MSSDRAQAAVTPLGPFLLIGAAVLFVVLTDYPVLNIVAMLGAYFVADRCWARYFTGSWRGQPGDLPHDVDVEGGESR